MRPRPRAATRSSRERPDSRDRGMFAAMDGPNAPKRRFFGTGATSPEEVARLAQHFKERLERNKTRRRRDGDPPAALPVPAGSGPKSPPLVGGAAAALEFDD